MNQTVFAKIRRTLAFAFDNKHSNFYREKYKKAGIHPIKDIKTSQDFQKLPYLTKEEVLEYDPWKMIFLPLDKIRRIGITSGTTGTKFPIVLFNSDYHRLQIAPYSNKLTELGIKMVLVLGNIISDQGRLVNTYTIREKFHKNIFWLFGDLNNLELTAKVMERLGVEAINTTPTALYLLLPHLKTTYDPENIRFLWLSGEHISETKLAFFKQHFKNAYFFFHYSSRETGGLGFRCDYLYNRAPRFYHPNGLFNLEVVAAQDEVGELVVTHLFTQTGFPLIRFRTRDMVKLTTTDCPCGNKELIELFGRADGNSVNVSGTLIYAQYLDSALLPYRKHIVLPDWRLHIYEKVSRERILVKLKLQLIPKKQSGKSAATLSDSIAQGVARSLYISATQTLESLVRKGVFLPLEIEFVESFPKEAKPKRFTVH